MKKEINAMVKECYEVSEKAGWWVNSLSGESIKLNPYCFSNKLMLIVSEISEAMEGDRKNIPDTHLPSRAMREVELADAIIRIFDLAGAYDMDLGGAIEEKMAYNLSRQDHKKEAREGLNGKAY